MGDRGTYASGNNVAYKFETVDLFEGVTDGDNPQAIPKAQK